MIRLLAISLALLSLLPPALAQRGTSEHPVRALYEQFALAQNARDLDRVRGVLLDSPQFLWISDGQSFWGRETMLERMASFQQAEVWEVEPELAEATVVSVGQGVAYLHLPLTLVIGSKGSPDRIRFLVSVLGVETTSGWRIAALFTTTAKGG